MFVTVFYFLTLIRGYSNASLFEYFSPASRAAVQDISSHSNWALLNGDSCGIASDTDRIIGGKIAKLGSKPWLVRVGYSGPSMPEISYRCGGAILNVKTIITAAHCVSGLPKDLKVAAVQVGEHNTKTDPDCMEVDGEEKVCAPPVQTLKPREIIIHADYNLQPFTNDIALIRVDELKLSKWVNPICVMHGKLLTEDFVGKIMEVAGWGIYNISDPKNSDVLLVVKLKVQKNEMCVEHYLKHAPIGPTQMCVGGIKGTDSCGGDSGGPLMHLDSTLDGDAREYIIGVVSFGSKKCGETEMPGIYTRLSSYIGWLLDNLRESKVNFKLIHN